MRRCKILIMAAMLSLASSAAFAEDSCVSSKQPDESTWKTCVNDTGKGYCQSPHASGACSNVTCKYPSWIIFTKVDRVGQSHYISVLLRKIAPSPWRVSHPCGNLMPS